MVLTSGSFKLAKVPLQLAEVPFTISEDPVQLRGIFPSIYRIDLIHQPISADTLDPGCAIFFTCSKT
ncbi:hypothetical protein NBRC111894_3964 [Sporolactobacillus inulinus]|uniref:Uncharacterized protein n=1 Tax=Sporolactobacillus inulinus TaxID=2078 RepID=A0A4Y1ZHF5_9BACL|nr:hypothetical protein NBRC111894_3964 [Sporolactobacillus inulinus]